MTVVGPARRSGRRAGRLTGHHGTVRILLVEDDPDLAEVVALGLRNESYAVDVAATYAEAEELLRTTAYDVACFDLGLPDGDGLDLVRRLADDPDLRRPRRSLVLTARDAVADRVAGLDAGADDYLVKPFHFAELVARLRALGRRGDEHGTTLRVGDLTLDLAAHRAWRSGRELRADRPRVLAAALLHAPPRRGAVGGGPARARVGRERRPVHVVGAGDPQPAAPEARRAGADRHDHRCRLPAGGAAVTRRWRSLRVRLALLGFLAIYVPVLLLFGVVLATDTETTTRSVDGVAVVDDDHRAGPRG